jgi:putative ABC transport system substrate-binding protein
MTARRLMPIVITLVLAGAAAPGEPRAQPARKPARVGYLEAGAAAGAPFFQAFRDGLRDLGWVEGQSVTIELRAAEGRYERLPGLAAELVRLEADVIFASSTPAAVAAQRDTATIPVVIGRVADPVKSGLVASLARPGGNVTGWTHQGLELRVKYLDLLKEAVPEATRIGVLWNPANPIHGPSLRSIEATASALGVTLHPAGVRRPEEIETAFAGLARQGVHALTVFQDGLFLARGAEIVALAARHRLPAIYGTTDLVRQGGLMGYGVNLPQMYRRGAAFVDRILRGARPADLPVEQPTTFELVVNLGTARALGLTIPPSVLARADQVVE